MRIIDILEEAGSVFSLLIESGIQLPKGTVAIKLHHHKDMDGVFSAIVAYNQLIKQGIKPNRIKISGIQYGDDDRDKQAVLNKFKKSKGQAVVLVDFARIPKEAETPDFWSDHHVFDGEKPKAAGKVGATEWKSDTSHLAILRTNNMVDGATLRAVDIIDSAGYTNLEDVINMPKDFKRKGRMERLAILSNALLVYSKIVNNEGLMNQFIRETKPSLVSFYNNILKYNRLSKVQQEAIKELSKKNPDWEKVEKARNLMPSMAAKEEVRRNPKVPLRDKLGEDVIDDFEEFEKLKKKGKRRTKKEENRFRELVNAPIDAVRISRQSVSKAAKDSSKFESRGSTIIQRDGRMQRYIWTQLNTKGLKHPFVIKRYPTFMQVAVNPELPSNIKELIDLNKIRNVVMGEIQKKFGNKYNKWAFEIIDRESGGHKNITNISSLGTLGIMPKRDRERLRELEELKSRISNLRTYGRGKLSDEDKKKLDNANKELSRETITPEEKIKYENIKKQITDGKNEITDEDKKRLKEANMMLIRKVLPAKEKEYYLKLKKILMPTMENLMPEKAEEMERLLNKKAEFAEERKKIMDDIEDYFIIAFKKFFNASDKIPVMGKNSNVKIPGGSIEYALESFLEDLKL